MWPAPCRAAKLSGRRAASITGLTRARLARLLAMVRDATQCHARAALASTHAHSQVMLRPPSRQAGDDDMLPRKAAFVAHFLIDREQAKAAGNDVDQAKAAGNDVDQAKAAGNGHFS